MLDDEQLMLRAIELSIENAAAGGGPFGAVVSLNGQIVGEGFNNVLGSGDPTCHAEIVAIRQACKALGTHVLANCVIHTSCEPCPMCLGAIWWSRIREIIYGNSRDEAAAIGFDDCDLYIEVGRPVSERILPMRRVLRNEARKAFELWIKNPNHQLY